MTGIRNGIKFVNALEKKLINEKLSRHISCRDCGYTGFVEAFPFSGPKEYHNPERYCPKCTSFSTVNASILVLCRYCREKPAMETDPYCKSCLEQIDAEDNKDSAEVEGVYEE